MKKLFAFVMTFVLALSMVACGSKVDVIKNFDELDTAKFHGCIKGVPHKKTSPAKRHCHTLCMSVPF